ncbi:MAG: hypothetical protein QME12_03510 [Nanoarchaeota archaeon]|nr:hypothetical protein [Nanoarchaeota archaeon]
MNAGKVASGLAALGIGVVIFSAMPHISRENLEVTVYDVRGNIVFTDKGNFENTRSAWEWKFSPYEFKEGQRYLIGVYGWEGPFNWKRNIMYAEELP